MTTPTPDHSDAAKAWADSLYPQALPNTKWEIGAKSYAAGHAAALATVAPVQPRVLTTAAELDALPVGAPIQDDARIARHRLASGDWTDPSGEPVTSWWLAESFGPLTLLAPVPATTEPERLTDPDDPRIKSGALVSYTTTTNPQGEVTIYHHRVDAIDGGCWSVNHIRQGIPHSEYHLLAPTPDPDAGWLEIVFDSLAEALTPEQATHIDNATVVRVLASLRKRGM